MIFALLQLINGNFEQVTFELDGKQGVVHGSEKHLEAAARDGSAVLLHADGAEIAIKVHDHECGRASFIVLLHRLPVFVAQTVWDSRLDETEFSMTLVDEDGQRFKVTVPRSEAQSLFATATRMFADNPSSYRSTTQLAIFKHEDQYKVSVMFDNGDRLDLIADDARQFGHALIAHADQIDKLSGSTAT